MVFTSKMCDKFYMLIQFASRKPLIKKALSKVSNLEFLNY